jgi:hypothetical protein
MSRTIKLKPGESAVIFKEDEIKYIPALGLEEKLENDEEISPADFSFLLTTFIHSDVEFAVEKWEEIAAYMEGN